MFWKVFFGVLAALIVFWLIAWFFFGLAVWGVSSAAKQELTRLTAAQQQQHQHDLAQREIDRYQSKMRHSVCRHGKVYVPRRSGTVTYYDPVVWRGTVVSCR